MLHRFVLGAAVVGFFAAGFWIRTALTTQNQGLLIAGEITAVGALVLLIAGYGLRDRAAR